MTDTAKGACDLLAPDHTGFVASGIVLADGHYRGVRIDTDHVSVALDLGTPLDGASGVLCSIAITNGNGSGIDVDTNNVGVAFDLCSRERKGNCFPR